jgi:hypothetical protein
MQAPRKESPREVVLQKGSTPIPMTASKSDCCPSQPILPELRKTGQIATLIQFGHIGRRQLMELANLAGELDPRIVPVVKDWERMKPPLQNTADLDALCELHDVDPAHFISVAAEAGLKYRDYTSVLLVALSLPKIIKRSIRCAMKDKGFRDREALMKHAGFLPVPRNSQFRMLNDVAIKTEVGGGGGSPLPRFGTTIGMIDKVTQEVE